MIIVDTLARQQWAHFVQRHPKGTIFHTPEMFDVFAGTRRQRPLMLAALDAAGEVLALLISVRVQTLADPLGSFSSRSLWYAEPLCREDPEGVEALTDLIRDHDDRVGGRALFSEVRALSSPGPEQRSLAACGYVWEPHLNFVIDLRRSRDELWNATSSSCRMNIRKGRKAGTEIVDATSADRLDELYVALQSTYEHAQVPLADKSMFARACEILVPRGMMKMFFAVHEGKARGVSVLLLHNGTAYEWYCTADRAKPLYPGECATWHRIEWAQANGFLRYDFGGAGSPDKPYGVRDFKARFGGELVNYGRYRKVHSRWRYQLAVKAYEVLRKSAYNRLLKAS